MGFSCGTRMYCMCVYMCVYVLRTESVCSSTLVWSLQFCVVHARICMLLLNTCLARTKDRYVAGSLSFPFFMCQESTAHVRCVDSEHVRTGDTCYPVQCTWGKKSWHWTRF